MRYKVKLFSDKLGVSYKICNQSKQTTTTQNQPNHPQAAKTIQQPPTTTQNHPTTTHNQPQPLTLATTTINKPKPDTATQN